MYAATSILIALRHAEATGRGQHIDLALLDTQAAMLANQGMNWLVGRVVPGRIGNRHPTIVPYTTFDTADGTVVIAVGNDGQFRALCRELGVVALADDARFATSAARLANRDAIEAEVQRLVGGLSSAALIDRLVACGVPAGPVNDIRQLFEDPNTTARGTVQRFDADGAEIPSVAFPGKLSETPAAYHRPPPRIGEHSDELLREWLGVDDERLAKLHATGAVVQR
jgi:crotonobetainyl-CoA:carnitine CoA-transferase CaiB-like acyl-CoA transferase